jgi:hypothetical protein
MNTQEDLEVYIDSLLKELLRQRKSLHGWTIDSEEHTGSIFWCRPMPEEEFMEVVYATPYWESSQDIAIQYEEMPSGEVQYEALDYKLTFSLEQDANNYFEAMQDYLKEK